MFIAHLESESYVNYKKLRDNFLSKVALVTQEEHAKIMAATQSSVLMDIVAANIDKTEFKTLEEAEAENKKVNPCIEGE